MSALVTNLLLFGRVLRAAGLQVHHGRLADAIRALEWHDDLPIFDEAFDLFFRAHGKSELNLPLFSLGERAHAACG